MIDRIYSFGDSFMYGADLSDATNEVRGYSRLTWPALVAKNLKLNYVSWAESGRGNQSIAFNIFKHANPDALNIINWTWIDRFDYNFTSNGWSDTIRPNGDELSKFYYKHIHTEFDDKIRNLTIIYSAISYLESNNMPYIMTYMDKLMLEKNVSILNLQKNVVNKLQNFPDNQTFLEWSRANNYPESQGWHPLEQAHEEAAKYWQPIYEKAINTHIT